MLAIGVLVVLTSGLLAGDPGDRDRDGTSTTTSAERPPDGTTTTRPTEVTVVADPESMIVLVDKWWRLPVGWTPPDLVEPQVPFTFTGPDPKRMLRAEAARALEGLFAAAAANGTPLAAVSGFRSEQVQADLFDLAVERYGTTEAERRSARPGHSEHQTGLAMDVTRSDGTCAAEACFADTPEARWLEQHAAAHGFIVRYPAGGEALTGYEHEPWHLRYVGVEVARLLSEHGLVLEQLPG